MLDPCAYSLRALVVRRVCALWTRACAVRRILTASSRVRVWTNGMEGAAVMLTVAPSGDLAGVGGRSTYPVVVDAHRVALITRVVGASTSS